jgi:hypothetical protein
MECPLLLSTAEQNSKKFSESCGGPEPAIDPLYESFIEGGGNSSSQW